MTMPIKFMRETIHSACLKNELQFQCAFGFLQDHNKIAEHINDMMDNDGNIKTMFENECQKPEATPSTYACIGENAPELFDDCHTVSFNTHFCLIISYHENMLTHTFVVREDVIFAFRGKTCFCRKQQ